MVDYSQEMDRELLNRLKLNKLNSIEKYAALDYLSLTDMKNLKLSSDINTSSTVSFTKKMYDNPISISNRINSYFLYLDGKMAEFENVFINSSINNSITLSSIDDNFLIEDEYIVVPGSSLVALNITLSINQDRDNVNVSNLTFVPGSTNLSYRITDISGDLLTSGFTQIDLSGENLIYYSFNSSAPNPYLNLSLSESPELRVGEGLEGNLNIIARFDHSAKNKIYLKAGGLIFIKSINVEKRGQLVLLEY